MYRTRRELEARLFLSKAGRRRAAPHRDPSWVEVIFGVSAFLAVAAACLYLVAWLGR